MCIRDRASESPHFMRFHVACPHCGEEQYLKFGDKETPFGLDVYKRQSHALTVGSTRCAG